MAEARVRETTKQRIEQVALDLFSTQGFDGTSLQQIADELGLTKAALYYHFKSKDELLDALVLPMLDEFEAGLDEAQAARIDPLDGEPRLEEYLTFLLEHRQVTGLLTRDRAVQAHPEIAARNLRIAARTQEFLVGIELGLADRIRVSMAIAAMQGAVADHGDEERDVLFDVVLGAVHELLAPARDHAVERASHVRANALDT